MDVYFWDYFKPENPIKCMRKGFPSKTVTKWMYILGIILNPKTHQVHEEGFSFKNSHKMDVFLGIILDRKTPSHSLISRG